MDADRTLPETIIRTRGIDYKSLLSLLYYI